MVRRKSSVGFTIIELLLVISLIGVLSGVLLSVVNPTKQKQIAEDGVKRSNIEKLAQSLETYNAAESVYPSRTDVTNFTGVVDRYIKVWPGAQYTYNTNVAAGVTSDRFEVQVVTSTNAARYLRYNSVWGQIKECGNGHTVGTWTELCN